MGRAALRERLRTRAGRITMIVVLVLAVAGIAATLAGSSGSVSTRAAFVTGTPEAGKTVELDTTLYLPDTTPAPAVLLTQGFGGDKSGLDAEATVMADNGFVVLTYSARGFGQSGGRIHFASPDYEVADAKLLVTHLAGMSQVKQVGGKPQIAAAGSSYGGGLSLLLAAADPRVGAVAADITWNNLSRAFFPNSASDLPGVFKKLWVGTLFGNAFGDQRQRIQELITGKKVEAQATGSVSCGRFAQDVCEAYQASAETGTPTAAMTKLMDAASPATVITKIKAPTLLTQGEQDSLFPLSEADANARGIAANGVPVKVVWRVGGHDAGSLGEAAVHSAASSWFTSVFDGTLPKTQPFEFSEQAGVVSAATGDAEEQILQASSYPGLSGVKTNSITLFGPSQSIASPAGGVPAVITSIPGLGGISGRFDRALAVLPSAPGQTATFVSDQQSRDLLVAGPSTVKISVTTNSSTDAVLYAGLRDLSNDGGAALPSQLISPIRLTGLTPGKANIVTVQLPSVVRNVAAGHRLALTVSASDFGYAGPVDARTYDIALVDGDTTVAVPTASGTPLSAGHPFAWLFVGVAISLLVAGAVATVIVRRRRVLKAAPELADVPVSVQGLVKEYAGGYRAVDDVSFIVERGQVVGLLGPNGAGKTTVLRVLVGLITPTAGVLHVFGEPIVPGAPVLARLGAFIEGPGFLPHLTGRENLSLYWASTGRPLSEAEFDTALDIAGLGASIDRRVRTYSQGMRQRLGIAQAMLGLPELLVLDEPTNGLDPPQIAEMREVLKQYAETGRTVIVSSHLLAEVEQTCTHVVVMHRGKLVAAGSVSEIAGAGGVQLAVDDPAEASRVLEAAGIGAHMVPAARRSLEDVFLDLIGDDVV